MVASLPQLRAFLQSRLPHNGVLLAALVTVAAYTWSLRNEGVSLQLRIVLGGLIPVIACGVMSAHFRSAGDEIETSFAAPTPLWERLLLVLWSALLVGIGGVAYASAPAAEVRFQQPSFIDFVGNVAGVTGLTLLALLVLPVTVSWMPSLVWLAGSLFGVLDTISMIDSVPRGVLWWPIAPASDPAAFRTELALLLLGIIATGIVSVRNRH